MIMSEELKHTPGPWDLDVRGYTFIVSGGIGYITRDVCRMDASTMAAFEQKANARLIAAAPDLLEALQNAKGFLDTPISRRRNEGDSFYGEIVASLNAAIAKAENPTSA